MTSEALLLIMVVSLKILSWCITSQILRIPYLVYCSTKSSTSMWQVSLDLVKSLYAKFIDWDYEMIDPETDTPSHATK